jgi:hypothetical protein
MSSIDNRMCINMNEIASLTEWLSRINYKVSNVELRRHFEPGVGPALTAYVETGDDEGYFKLLTTNEEENRHRLEKDIKLVIESKKANKEEAAKDKTSV